MKQKKKPPSLSPPSSKTRTSGETAGKCSDTSDPIADKPKPDLLTSQLDRLRREIETALQAPHSTLPVSPAVLRALLDEQDRQAAELRRIQLELATTRDRYARLYDFAPVGLLSLDEQGRILEANLTAGHLLGQERTALIHAMLDQFLLAKEQPNFRKYLDVVRKDQEIHISDIFVLKHNNIPHLVRFEGMSASREPHGMDLSFRIALLDMTEQEQSASWRQKQEAWMTGVLDTAMDAIISITKDQRILLFNKAAGLMFRCDPSDAIGQPLDRFIPERFRRRHRKHVERFGGEQETSRHMGRLGMVYGLRAGGEEFPIEASISQIVIEKEKIYTVILRDITEQTRDAKALRDSQLSLQAQERELRELASALLTAQEEERRRISRELHDDINQRLAVLAFHVQSLQQQIGESPALGSSLQDLYEETVDLSDRVRHLAHQFHPAILDDLGLEIAINSFIQGFMEREGIPVEFHREGIPRHLPPQVASALYRVVQEGLRNAARHARPTRVYVTLKGTPEGLHLCVRDDGVGFDPKVIPEGKRGLGLLSMKERIRLARGTFHIDAEPGKGTEICARIPLSEEPI